MLETSDESDDREVFDNDRDKSGFDPIESSNESGNGEIYDKDPDKPVFDLSSCALGSTDRERPGGPVRSGQSRHQAR